MSINNQTINYKNINGIALAYLGDSEYEVYIRKHLINNGFSRPNDLHRRSTKYVSAKAQAALIRKMNDMKFLKDEELEIFKKGRNSKVNTKAKHTDIDTYHTSTGFEAIIGYLSIVNKTDRLVEIVSWCIEQVEKGDLMIEK